jgi:hypothetical protein
MISSYNPPPAKSHLGYQPFNAYQCKRAIERQDEEARTAGNED